MITFETILESVISRPDLVEKYINLGKYVYPLSLKEKTIEQLIADDIYLNLSFLGLLESKERFVHVLVNDEDFYTTVHLEIETGIYFDKSSQAYGFLIENSISYDTDCATAFYDELSNVFNFETGYLKAYTGISDQPSYCASLYDQDFYMPYPITKLDVMRKLEKKSFVANNYPDRCETGSSFKDKIEFSTRLFFEPYSRYLDIVFSIECNLDKDSDSLLFNGDPLNKESWTKKLIPWSSSHATGELYYGVKIKNDEDHFFGILKDTETYDQIIDFSFNKINLDEALLTELKAFFKARNDRPNILFDELPW